MRKSCSCLRCALDESFSCWRMIVIFFFQGKILVGTKDSEIIEITEKTASSQVRNYIYFCCQFFCFVLWPCLTVDKFSWVVESLLSFQRQMTSIPAFDRALMMVDENFRKLSPSSHPLTLFDPRSFLLTLWNLSWFQTIVRAHGEGEIWGLACHPEREVFVTASDDQTVRLWDVASKVNTISVVINSIGWVIGDL